MLQLEFGESKYEKSQSEQSITETRKAASCSSETLRSNAGSGPAAAGCPVSNPDNLWKSPLFHEQSTKVKLLVLKLRQFCILHGSEVTLFYEIPITRVQSNVIGIAQLWARYVNTASEVKFHVHSGTSERKTPFRSL